MKKNNKIIFLIGSLVLIKLLHSVLKRDNTIEDPITNKNNDEDDILDMKTSIEKTFPIKNYENENNLDINPVIEKPKEIGKTKWLHSSDEFEIMEKGVVIKSKTYNHEITEKPKVLGKNSFLYPTDEFGDMEEGRVF